MKLHEILSKLKQQQAATKTKAFSFLELNWKNERYISFTKRHRTISCDFFILDDVQYIKRTIV